MKNLIGKSIVIACIFMLLSSMANAESYSSRVNQAKEALLHAFSEIRSSNWQPVLINQERKAIGRALIEVQYENWPSVLQYYTDDIEYQDPIITIEGIDMMTEFLNRLFESSPDLVTIIEDETCINGIYTATWTMYGSFNGVPYAANGMSILKFRPNEVQVYYQKDYYTEGDIMINISGLDEPAVAFRTYYQCSVDPSFPCPF